MADPNHACCEAEKIGGIKKAEVVVGASTSRGSRAEKGKQQCGQKGGGGALGKGDAAHAGRVKHKRQRMVIRCCTCNTSLLEREAIDGGKTRLLAVSSEHNEFRRVLSRQLIGSNGDWRGCKIQQKVRKQIIMGLLAITRERNELRRVLSRGWSRDDGCSDEVQEKVHSRSTEDNSNYRLLPSLA